MKIIFYKMKDVNFYILFALLIAISCTKKQKNKNYMLFTPNVVEAKGYIVPTDSMAIPKTVIVSNPPKIMAGKPRVEPINSNIHFVGIPKQVIVGTPKTVILGDDYCLYPKSIPAIDRPFLAGIPKVVIAKDASIKDQNPKNFSSFGKLQGLNHNQIKALLQDQGGNLWFGTYGGGATKYDGKYFTHYTEAEGLSNNRVYSILQDKRGNIWFGTYGGGVTKFDGKHFTHFTEKEGLSNNIVYCILQDKSGNLWFGTDGGVSKYDGEIQLTGQATFTNFTEREGLSNNHVYSILQDKSGNIWFGTDGGGVSKYEETAMPSRRVIITHFTEKEGLSNNSVYSILEDNTGDLWFGTFGGGVTQYNGRTFTHYTEKEGLSSNRVYSILQDKQGIIWFGTNGGGVSQYDGKVLPANKARFTHFTEKEGLNSNNVYSILQDRSGNLWFGTFGGGISRYDGKSFLHFTKEEGSTNNMIYSIKQVRNGNMWFGSDGDGVSEYDGKSFTWFTEKEGLCNNRVISILQDKIGNLWFGTYGGGASKFDGEYFTHYTEREGLCNNRVLSIYQDQRGNIWFGTINGVSKFDGKSFTHFTAKEGLSSNMVWSISQDKIGNLWFGTLGGGVTKYDGEIMPAGKATFTHFTQKEGLSNNRVNSILADKSGNIWFATYGGGVSKYDGKSSFTHFTEKDGLSNNFVYSLIEDQSGNLWFGTRFGLSKLSQNYLSKFSGNQLGLSGMSNSNQPILFKNFTYDDGFLGIGCNREAICEDIKGNIWIGANDRLTLYNPEGDDPDTIPPNVQLMAIQLFNENIPWVKLLIPSHEREGQSEVKDTSITLGNGVTVSDFIFDETTRWYGLPQNLNLRYNNNFITFKYIGITLKQSKQVKYQYMLEGLDENWCTPTLLTEASYGNLLHGNYTFKVKAMNSEGYWSKEYSYSFSIRPPWWKTWWFRVFVIFLVTTCLFGFYRWRVAILRRQKIELERLVREKTAEVVMQKEELEAMNEELTVTNEELYYKREEILTQTKMLQAHEEELEAFNEELTCTNEELHYQREEILSQAERLKQQNDKLREMDEFKQGMTSMIVHDLKNPLNLILNIPKSFEPERKDRVVQQSGKQMLNLVLNILDVNKYEGSSMIISAEELPLARLLRNASDQVRFLCEQKGITVFDKVEAGLAVKADGEVIERVLVNLLTNAVKFTPSGGTIMLSTRKAADGKVRIEVTDTGEGIAEDKMNLVFQKFGQIVAKKSGTVKSTGLGLAFCKMAAEAHGGEIGVRSEVGQGTTFWFTLPLTDAEQVELPAEEEAEEKKAETLIFTEEEIKILEPFICKLKAFTVYETDDIEEILATLKQTESESIKRWISQVENTINTLNQIQFLELLKIG